jgi:hypothetical protein
MKEAKKKNNKSDETELNKKLEVAYASVRTSCQMRNRIARILRVRRFSQRFRQKSQKNMADSNSKQPSNYIILFLEEVVK